MTDTTPDLPAEGKSYFDFEPARALAALLVFGGIVIFAISALAKLDGYVVGVIQGLWTGFCAFINSFIVRSKVTANPNVALTSVQKGQLETAGFTVNEPLAPNAPVIPQG